MRIGVDRRAQVALDQLGLRANGGGQRREDHALPGQAFVPLHGGALRANRRRNIIGRELREIGALPEGRHAFGESAPCGGAALDQPGWLTGCARSLGDLGVVELGKCW